MSGTPLVVLAGGGTGGHLFPLLAVAGALRNAVGDVRFVLFGTGRAIDRSVVAGSGLELVAQSVRPLHITKPWTFPGFLAAWIRACRTCRVRLEADRPAIVLGSGGFASGPPVFEARRAGIPTALINPDAIPGRANRFLASRVDVVFAQWEESASCFPGHPGFKVTGCPIRAEFQRATRETGIARFGLDNRRRTLLITGASQGARTINDAVVAILDDLAAVGAWQVLHITGSADLDGVRRAYAARNVPGTVLAFTEHMPDALAAADLVLSRAGASSLAEITAVGRPAILMPYPHHRDRHQDANAAVLVGRGAAIIVTDTRNCQETAASLRRELLHLLRDRPALTRMAEAARSLGRPDAAGAIAAELVGLSRGMLTTNAPAG